MTGLGCCGDGTTLLSKSWGAGWEGQGEQLEEGAGRGTQETSPAQSFRSLRFGVECLVQGCPDCRPWYLALPPPQEGIG